MDFSFSESQLALQKMVKHFTRREIEPLAKEIDACGRLPDNLIEKMAKLGLLGMTIPRKYGGSATGNLNCIIALEQLAYSGTGVWWLAAFNTSIPNAIYRFGTARQRNTYLPPLCTGTAYASIQFTEDDTGSDPDALKTEAKLRSNRYFLSGNKRFSTFGARDGFAITFAKDSTGGCSAFIVKKNLPGYSVSKNWTLTGSGGIETVDIAFDELPIPATDLLGKPGDGFKILLYWIAIEKIEQAGASVGIGQAALDEAVAYVRKRLVRNRPISEMQGVRWMLAEMEAKITAARWLTYRAAYLHDHDQFNWMTESAKTKIAVVPAMIEVVEMSRRLHGAYGYTSDSKIERLVRAISGSSAVAVSLEINKSIVARELLDL